ncbi:DUF2569 family protein [Photorhabdus africana]|uniref:DUF2569 family protein n=1 Tax=Photorhabdus africana TaxID=3097554 RepID=UPI002B415CA6|nr:DUF2569 family protein [Photorhabdus sp. CRI-LC]
MKCIKCENRALHESDFCAACEAKELSGIGGFLYFPAINLIFVILSSLFSAYKTMTILISGYDFLGELRIFIGFEFICFIIIFGVALYTSILFFRKKKKEKRKKKKEKRKKKKEKNTFILYYPFGFYFIICNNRFSIGSLYI